MSSLNNMSNKNLIIVFNRAVLLIVFICFISSCSFNKIFLHPTKLPSETKTLTFNTKSDTLQIRYHENFQPVFFKSETDTFRFDYTIESVVFESTSGNKLNGWFLKPNGITPTVTLLHFHGNAGSLLSQFQAISPLIKYGYQVFLFDYSGFGFSEGSATRKNVLKDGNSALTYLKQRPDVAGTKLVLYGQSLGGHLAGVVGAMRENEIDALVIEGAFSSHKDIAAYQAGFLGKMIVSEQYSAKDSLKNYNKPLLVIHSIEDGTVPFDLGMILFEHANEPKEFYEINKCHICGPKYYTDSISAKIMRMVYPAPIGTK